MMLKPLVILCSCAPHPFPLSVSSMSLPCIRPLGALQCPSRLSPVSTPLLFHKNFLLHSNQTTIIPQTPLQLLTSVFCSSSGCLPYWGAHPPLVIPSSKIQFTDRRAHSARHCQHTVGESGKPNSIFMQLIRMLQLNSGSCAAHDQGLQL